MTKPPSPYRGDQPYVFVCYSHADAESVMPEMQALEARGIRFWYDEGISPGHEWSEELGQAIRGATRVLFWVTNNSTASRHCRNEIHFALDCDKPVVAVHLEPVNLPAGLQLAIGSAQAIQGYRLSAEECRDRILHALADESQLATSESQSAPIEHQRSTAPRRTRKALYIAVCVCLAAALGSGYLYRDSIRLVLALNFPILVFGEPIEQELGFAEASDGTRIAYATSGKGPPILHLLTLNTHLKSGQNSPIYDNDRLVAMSSENNFFVRFDGRGSGLSDRDPTDFSLAARLSDIEAVVDAVGMDRFGILAVSAGGQAAIAYTARNPERVDRLVLAGTGASYDHLSAKDRAAFEQMLDLFEVGWHRPEVAAIQASMILGPDADLLDKRFFAEMLQRSTDGPAMAGFLRASLAIDVLDEAEQIRVPTLVLQARDDTVVPMEVGRELASIIPGARLEIVDGSHMASSASTAETRRIALRFLSKAVPAPSNQDSDR